MLDVYGHLYEGADEAAAERLDEQIASGSDGHQTDSHLEKRDRTRTPNRKNPIFRKGFRVVEVRGFEPLASSVRGKRSAGLSYTPNWGGNGRCGPSMLPPLFVAALVLD